MGNELANWSVVCHPKGANFSLFRDTYPQALLALKFDIGTVSIV